MALFAVGMLFLIAGCKKSGFLNHKSGTWEIESMQIDYLNASGGTDSTASSNITGFFMFYDTPTTGEDPFYLSTNGITVKGSEWHAAHFYRSDGTTLTMVTSIGQAEPDRSYTISDSKRNQMTLDYTGNANGMYAFYTGKIKEHIVLKRIKF
jgi:hypothetical protein